MTISTFFSMSLTIVPSTVHFKGTDLFSKILIAAPSYLQVCYSFHDLGQWLYFKNGLLLNFVKNPFVIYFHELCFFFSNDNRSTTWALNHLGATILGQTSKEECIVSRIEIMQNCSLLNYKQTS